jgi:hypothetical protein
MTVADSIKNAISIGDIKSIRIMMKNSLLVDPTFAEFNEMSGLVRGVSGLYDLHDGREFEYDKSAWNDDYMNKIMVQVVSNFSHERLDHLKEVVRHLRPVAASHPKTAQSGGSGYSAPGTPSAQAPSAQAQRGYHEQKQDDQRSGSYRGAKIGAGAAAGAIVGGVVAGVVVSAVSGAVAIGAAAGAVVGGVAVAIATNEER